MVQLRNHGRGVKADFGGQTGIALGLLFMVKRVGMVLRNMHAKSYGSSGEFTLLLYF